MSLPFDCEVEQCDYEDIAWQKHEARREGVTMKPHKNAQWFKIGNMAFACLWEPGNFSNRGRMAHCFVTQGCRGQGMGKRLVKARVSYAEDNGYDAIDTYAFNPDLFSRLGFVELNKYDNGTYYMVKSLD